MRKMKRSEHVVSKLKDMLMVTTEPVDGFRHYAHRLSDDGLVCSLLTASVIKSGRHCVYINQYYVSYSLETS